MKINLLSQDAGRIYTRVCLDTLISFPYLFSRNKEPKIPLFVRMKKKSFRINLFSPSVRGRFLKGELSLFSLFMTFFPWAKINYYHTLPCLLPVPYAIFANKGIRETSVAWLFTQTFNNCTFHKFPDINWTTNVKEVKRFSFSLTVFLFCPMLLFAFRYFLQEFQKHKRRQGKCQNCVAADPS